MKRTTLITADDARAFGGSLCAQDNPPGTTSGKCSRWRWPWRRAPAADRPGFLGCSMPITTVLSTRRNSTRRRKLCGKLDVNGDGRVTPDEMRPRDDGQRRPDAGPARTGTRWRWTCRPGLVGNRGLAVHAVQARRDGFGPRQFGDRIERRAPDRGVGPQRFAQRNPRMREDRAAAGPRAMGPAFRRDASRTRSGERAARFRSSTSGCARTAHTICARRNLRIRLG
jgi:hypothetical protein